MILNPNNADQVLFGDLDIEESFHDEAPEVRGDQAVQEAAAPVFEEPSPLSGRVSPTASVQQEAPSAAQPLAIQDLRGTDPCRFCKKHPYITAAAITAIGITALALTLSNT